MLFDLDGTLLDTLQDIVNTSNKVLTDLGLPPHTPQEYKYLVGEGREMMALRMLPEDLRNPEMIAKVVAGIDVEYAAHWADTTYPYPGIPELLQTLTQRGIKLAVLSNKPDDSTKMMIATMLPQFKFEEVHGIRPGVPRKPDPAAAIEIAHDLHIAPGAFLYLGDSATDMKTATAAGMFPVGALWGFRTAGELLENGAKALAAHPLDVMQYI